MKVLGVNAVFHDPAAALVVDGDHGRGRRGGALLAPQARQAAGRLLDLGAARAVDGVVPRRGRPRAGRPRRRRLLLRPRARLPARTATSPRRSGRACARSTRAARRCSCAPRCPGSTRTRVRWVPHHVAHAASATFASGFDPCSVLVLDGRGERASHLAGRVARRRARGARRAGAAALARAALRGADRAPRLPPLLRRVQGDGDGVLRGAGVPRRASASWCAPTATAASPSRAIDFAALRAAARARRGVHAGARRARRDGAAAARGGAARPRPLAARAHGRPRPRRWRAASRSTASRTRGCGAKGRSSGSGCSRPRATPAPRSARRCTSRTSSATPSRRWRPRRSGAAGTTTALAAPARHRRRRVRAARRRRRRGRRGARRQPGRRVVPGPLGVRPARARAPLAARRPARGRRTWRSSTTSRAASSSGPSRRWCSPSGRRRSSTAARSRARSCSSRTGCGTGWAERIPAVVHVDGTARIQTVDRDAGAADGALPRGASRRAPACPCVVNTSLNTAGRPMVDDPRDALECFGSAPVDVLAIGPFLVRRAGVARRRDGATPGRGVTRRHRRPDAGRAPACARCSRRWRGDGRGRARRGRRRPARRRRAARRSRPAWRVVRGPARGPAAARNAGWRACDARRGSRSSTTTSSREPGWRGAARRRPRRAPARDVGGVQGRIVVPLPRGPAPDRLGAQHARARARALGDGRPGLPARGARGRRRLRRALPARLPRGRRPRPARRPRRAGGSCAATARVLPPGAPGARRGLAAPSRPATPTTC